MTDDVSPIDDPNKVASLGLTTFAPGRKDRMEVVVAGQAQMISNSLYSIEGPLLLLFAPQSPSHGSDPPRFLPKCCRLGRKRTALTKAVYSCGVCRDKTGGVPKGLPAALPPLIE